MGERKGFTAMEIRRIKTSLQVEIKGEREREQREEVRERKMTLRK